MKINKLFGNLFSQSARTKMRSKYPVLYLPGFVLKFDICSTVRISKSWCKEQLTLKWRDTMLVQSSLFNFFFIQMYNLIIKWSKLKSSALGSFLLYEKDKCNDCNCSFTLTSKNLGKSGLWTVKFPILGF